MAVYFYKALIKVATKGGQLIEAAQIDIDKKEEEYSEAVRNIAMLFILFQNQHRHKLEVIEEFAEQELKRLFPAPQRV